MELKKHTPEEFELMSDAEYEDYETRLFDLANDIGLQRNSLEELETALLNIKELAKKKKYGHDYWQCSKEETKCMSNILSAAEKFKKTFIKEIAKFIGKGMLILSRTIKYKDIYGGSYVIKYIYKERCYDLYDECEYTEVISCAENPGDEETIEMHLLPVDVLMKIYLKIVNGDALLVSDEELIACNINSEDIKL